MAYDLQNVGFITVNLTDSSGNAHIWKSTEGSGSGQLKLGKLKADNHYTGTFSCDHATLPLNFTTLKKPKREMSGSFALIADPHLSFKKENRKGRFMVESKMIFQDVIEQCNQLFPDFVLLPGDITNNAEPNEFKVTTEILNQLTAKYIAILGNHDVHCQAGDDPYRLWEKFFGKTDGIFNTSCGTVIALDTACGYLTYSSDVLLKKALKDKHKKPLIITHFQLFYNEKVYRGGSQKVISNASEHSLLLEQLIKKPAIIYAGHQNIPAVKSFGKTFQVNLPQPTQYPCGFVYVRCYDNILYHTFKPISSEILRQWSRRIGSLSARQYSEDQWDSDYREGKSSTETNFIAKL